MKPSPSSLTVFAGLVALLGAPTLGRAQDPEVPASENPLIGPPITTGGSSASEGAEFLLLPVGARAVGMGGAVTGMRGTGDLVLWNPAGVAGMTERRVLVNHSEGVFDTSSEVIGLIWPTESLGTIGITYYLVDFGELPSTDIDGLVQGTINFRNQEFLFTYATQLVGTLEAGFNYKLVQLIFRCDGLCADQRSFTRTTHAIDLGLIYEKALGLPLSLGGSIRHLGFALQGAATDDPLPTRVRIGVAYHAVSLFADDSPFALAVAVDVEDRVREFGDPDVMIGSEFGVAERIFLRAGYSFVDTGLGGPALGFGLVYDWFYLDLSRGFDDVSQATGEEAMQVSFGVIF
jgi:hypothetical protein